MSESLAQFEDRLRQLAPAGCDDLTEETFYLAGWNAALLSRSQQSSRPARIPRSAALFVSGLLCGLLCWTVSIVALTSTGDDRASVQIEQMLPDVQNSAAPSALKSNDPVHASNTPPLPDAPQQSNDRFLIAAMWAPWNWSHTSFNKGMIPLASQPLSAAARHQWSSIVSTDASWHTSGTETAANSSESSEQLQLRAFPLSGVEINELL